MKPAAKQASWAGVAMLALTMLSSYISIKYERHQVAQALEAQPAEVNVTVTGNTGPVHAHGAVLSQIDIGVLIANAIADQHALDLIKFKQLETWERP